MLKEPALENRQETQGGRTDPETKRNTAEGLETAEWYHIHFSTASAAMTWAG